VPVVVNTVGVYFVPESPYWLVEHGRANEARASLVRLRRPASSVEQELQEIIEKKKSKEGLEVSLLGKLTSRQFLLPFFRIGLLMWLSQWAGIHVITTYMVTIFQQSGSSVDPQLAPIIVSCIQQALALLAAAVLRVSPRKPLFMVCGVGIAAAQVGLGTHARLDPGGEQHGWIPILCVITVNACNTLGFLSVVQILIAESFPTEIRSYASGLCGAASAVHMFGATKLYPQFLSLLGRPATFWLYGAVMVVEIVYAAITIPENRGESLVRTEEKLAGRAGRGAVNLGAQLPLQLRDVGTDADRGSRTQL